MSSVIIRPYDSSTDLPALWQAYKMDSFPLAPTELSAEAFRDFIGEVCSRHSACIIVECPQGRPVCFVGMVNDGWILTPHVDFFTGVSARTILRCNLAFFNLVANSAEVGVCIIRTLKNTLNLFRHLERKKVLSYVGVIPSGDPAGDIYEFFLKGAKHGYGL
jgi:hypothetical protein